MSGSLTILIVVALAAVLVALGFGVFSMLKGGEFAKRHGNRLMQIRVVLQITAVVLIGLAFYLRDG
jgi:hypothetical protein